MKSGNIPPTIYNLKGESYGQVSQFHFSPKRKPPIQIELSKYAIFFRLEIVSEPFFSSKINCSFVSCKIDRCKTKYWKTWIFQDFPPLDRCYFDKSQLLCKPIQIYVIWIRAILKKEFKNYVRLYAIRPFVLSYWYFFFFVKCLHFLKVRFAEWWSGLRRTQCIDRILITAFECNITIVIYIGCLFFRNIQLSNSNHNNDWKERIYQFFTSIESPEAVTSKCHIYWIHYCFSPYEGCPFHVNHTNSPFYLLFICFPISWPLCHVFTSP